MYDTEILHHFVNPQAETLGKGRSWVFDCLINGFECLFCSFKVRILCKRFNYYITERRLSWLLRVFLHLIFFNIPWNTFCNNQMSSSRRKLCCHPKWPWPTNSIPGPTRLPDGSWKVAYWALVSYLWNEDNNLYDTNKASDLTSVTHENHSLLLGRPVAYCPIKVSHYY